MKPSEAATIIDYLENRYSGWKASTETVLIWAEELFRVGQDYPVEWIKEVVKDSCRHHKKEFPPSISVICDAVTVAKEKYLEEQALERRRLEPPRFEQDEVKRRVALVHQVLNREITQEEADRRMKNSL